MQRGFVRHHFLAPTGKVLSHLFHQTQSAMLFLILLPTLLLPVRWPNLKRFALLSSPVLIPFVMVRDFCPITPRFIPGSRIDRSRSCLGILIAAAILASRGSKTTSAQETAQGEHELAAIPQRLSAG